MVAIQIMVLILPLITSKVLIRASVVGILSLRSLSLRLLLLLSLGRLLILWLILEWLLKLGCSHIWICIVWWRNHRNLVLWNT